MNPNTELFTLLAYQSHINKVLKTKTPTPKTREIFENFSALLKHSAYTTSLKISNFSCEFCSTIIKTPPIILPCNHYICSESCFQELALSQLQGQFHLYDRVKCLCNAQIPSQLTFSHLKSITEFSINYRKCVEGSEPAVTCSICFTIKKMRNFITLSCEHRYCEECLKQYIQGLIKTGQVGDSLVCPECQKAIEYHIAASLIDPQTKDQYERFLMMKIECKQYERYFACPGVDCGNAKIIPSVLKVFQCDECNNNFCVDCKDVDHDNVSCEANARAKRIDDPLIIKKIEDGEMKMCPWCFNFIERDPRGCKYMTCRSEECNGKRYFCFDCSIKLKKFHEAHPCVTPEVEVRNCEIY